MTAQTQIFTNMSQPQFIDCWEITPHQNRQYDTCIVPFAADDPTGRKALELAKETLEHLWDTAESLTELDITVRFRRTEVNEENIDDGK